MSNLNCIKNLKQLETLPKNRKDSSPQKEKGPNFDQNKFLNKKG